ncbi:aminotransferase class I/II-fold pyridoxal phosphate-dependent enzyme [Bacillus sp. S/N-304-OC-R1]|uniref:aminotransferase class I/II-fold pyridoxal phosphate-dependent enzyme n=1 Tax=Bacillus sp. S/N-304-OC-R1 TaxID=2758034 RepID=UPI001C8D201C|nr:aminotransferase class I/II-fold pyridoxal phosphate-dependent enzyme [Bacillus sp. S/N-304-OC-R1]MBY0124485.1 aminotransferase class I/II-fold pyridoxal phosphate-dependent enzyme [Bacillus sp. S/N-304-OC-R1]MBY0124560.1 aminotransferase class I/II-fold pyridoxal phosphate-dependent enzyme [Bacillus sp. S/N-304-OC-R1]
MNQKKIPLLDALMVHTEKNPVSFHVPGHKYGSLIPEAAKGYFQDLLKLDATELNGLDDLHAPEGVILDAENLLADFYGTKKSFFLVNGSTVGNLAMIMAAIEENDTVLVQRNCHKSILNGVHLVKANPVFLAPDFVESWGVAGGVSLQTVKAAIHEFPEAKSIILTYPNYYGMVTELEEIIEFSHSKGISVLIDEAHGAHFAGGDVFPKSAVQLKADIVVQSAHKTLPAMTMGAYLHVNSEILSEIKVSHYLQILQSSSPSYPIMASLDIARHYLATFSNKDMKYLINKIEEFRTRLQELNGVKVLSYPNGIGDPLKITIQSASSLNGYELQSLLEGTGIYAEMADPYNVLLVFPLLKDGEKFAIEEIAKRFERALQSVSNTNMEKVKSSYGKPRISKLALNARQIEKLKPISVPLDESTEKICAQLIIPYPPGIPLLFPGEKIREEDIDFIKLLLKSGARFQGGDSLKSGRLDIFPV